MIFICEGLLKLVLSYWFEKYEDYVAIQRSCDLGVSLHCFSSTLDFPMKAVDMVAQDLPVVALDYPGIKSGPVMPDLLFSTEHKLASIIISEPPRTESYCGPLWKGEWTNGISSFLS